MPSSLNPIRRLAFAATVIATVTTGVALAGSAPAMDDALRVLPLQMNGPKSEGMLRNYLRKESHALLAQRLEKYEALKSVEAIHAYRQDLRAHFIAALGGYPERTPLNAKVVGHLEGEGFRAEKIVYESQPRFFVTAILYLPEGNAPHPVVLMPCGHTQNGKAGYQQAAVTLARNGLAVFCFDPIGQGERVQLLAVQPGNDGRKTFQFPTTNEHMVTGVAPILLGRSLASHMIWDGTRAIDYLATRKDLDPKRLGCAGNSGGGMMTSYLMALDDRIVSAAPSCFMTTSRHKNERPGPGDAEQNIYGQYAFGLDHPDFIILHAPQPVLIGTATRDYVPIEGAWEAFRQGKRVYTRLGYAERLDLIETDAPHGFSIQLREGVTRWMRRWLLNQDDVVFEQPTKLFADRELECTSTGNVLELAGARTIFDLNREEAARLARQRKQTWDARTPDERRRMVRTTAGIRDELGTAHVERSATISRPGYTIQKIVVTPEIGIELPALHFVPEKPSGKASLYLHGRGKHVDAGPAGPIERLVREGTEVLAVDLRGFGETAMSPWRTAPADVAGPNGAEAFVAYMMGRSLAGMRAEDTLVAAKLLPALSGPANRRIELIAVEDAGIPALHAAALAPELFSNVQIVRTIQSWERVIEATVTKRQFENVVHGALRVYDLPNLAEMAGNAQFVEVADAMGRLDRG
jgi:cephalosporin-C deacetylase-like acetyl esterase